MEQLRGLTRIYSQPCHCTIVIPTAQMRVKAREGKQLVQGNRQVSAGAVMRLQSPSLAFKRQAHCLRGGRRRMGGVGRGVNFSFHKPFPLGFQLECPLEKQFSSNRYTEKPRE